MVATAGGTGFANSPDLLRDIVGRLAAGLGEGFDLWRHYREAPARYPGARGLDRRVQREEIGLLRQPADEIGNRQNLLDRSGELRQFLTRAFRLLGSACRRNCWIFCISRALLRNISMASIMRPISSVRSR